MFEKILVPLDRSLLAEKALTLASKIARQNKARLILLHVASPQLSFVEPVGSYPISDFTLEELKKIPEDYLQNLASSPELKGLMVKTVIESGDAASTMPSGSHSSTAAPSSGRKPIPDLDLSALTREQKQVLFS